MYRPAREGGGLDGVCALPLQIMQRSDTKILTKSQVSSILSRIQNDHNDFQKRSSYKNPKKKRSITNRDFG